jgi:predicted Zn-ribbon and HTH transcriptional regulator
MLDAPQQITLSETPPDDPLPDVGGSTLESTDDDFELADGLNMMTQEEHAQIQAQQAAETDAARTPDEIYSIKRNPKQAPTESRTPTPADSGIDKEPSSEAAGSAAPESPTATPKEEPAPVQSTGDPLLDIAIQEENEAKARQKGRRKKRASGERQAMPGFVFVFCPNGHRIQVEDRHRGQTGRCPRCKSFFHVPGIDWDAEKRKKEQAEQEKKKESRFTGWMLDMRLHQVDPTKLKLKPGSLEKDFQEVDLGYAVDQIIVVTNGKQGAGLFVGEKNKKKKEELRAEMQDHLRLEKEILDLPAAGYRLFGKEDMEKVSVVQPAAYAHESMFAGIPVFGTGRIAVRLPVTQQDKDVKDILFVSFGLSGFREFAKHLDEMFEVKDLGQLEGVPLEDSKSNYKCHYSDRKIDSIEATEFHTSDPGIELEIVGRKCQGCGLVVSEDSRKKEKLGGANGKGIAKAKCPKCKGKFGDTTLYAIKVAEAKEEGMSESGGMNS